MKKIKVQRSAEQIMILILRTTLKPTLSTHLLHSCNLTSYLKDKTCAFLEERGFLERVRTPTTYSHRRATRRDKRVKFLYRTTDKGVRLLKDIDCSDMGELFDYRTWARRQGEQ